MANSQRYIPIFTDGKRDKARRYIDTQTNLPVSRRQAENLTAKQKVSKQQRKQKPATPITKKRNFIVKKRQELAHFNTYRIRAYSLDEAIVAYSQSRQAQKLKPAYIKIVAKGIVQDWRDSGHEDTEGVPNWRTILPPQNPDDMQSHPYDVYDIARSNIEAMFEAEPFEFMVVVYVDKDK
jgi:hypothetical protein